MKKLPIILLIITLLSGCKLENIELLKGNQTFTCKKNDEKWTAYVGINFTKTKNVVCFFDRNTLRITALLLNNQGFKEQKFSINLAKFKGKGTYLIDSTKTENSLNFVEVYDGNISVYKPFKKEISEIKITQISLVDGKICGTFKFKLKNDEGKVINFTKGKFDLYVTK